MFCADRPVNTALVSDAVFGWLPEHLRFFVIQLKSIVVRNWEIY
jgi:trans-aconitate methyltransferase